MCPAQPSPCPRTNPKQSPCLRQDASELSKLPRRRCVKAVRPSSATGRNTVHVSELWVDRRASSVQSFFSTTVPLRMSPRTKYEECCGVDICPLCNPSQVQGAARIVICMTWCTGRRMYAHYVVALSTDCFFCIGISARTPARVSRAAASRSQPMLSNTGIC